MEKLSVVGRVEEVRDFIVVFSVEKLPNTYFENKTKPSPTKSFAIKKRNCSQECIGNVGLPRAGENPLSCVCGGEITFSRVPGVLREVRVVISSE